MTLEEIQQAVPEYAKPPDGTIRERRSALVDGRPVKVAFPTSPTGRGERITHNLAARRGLPAWHAGKVPFTPHRQGNATSDSEPAKT